MKSPPEIEAGAFKACDTTRKRQRAQTTQQISHPSALATANANSVRSYSVVHKPRSSRTGDRKAVASPSTAKRPASIYSLSSDDEDCDIYEPTWEVTKKTIPQTEINMEMQPPMGNRLSTPLDSARKSSSSTKKEPATQKPKHSKRKTTESKQSRGRPRDSDVGDDLANCSDSLSRANFNKNIELSQATLSKLGHFRYKRKPTVDHSAMESMHVNKGNLLSGADDIIGNVVCPNPLQDSHLDSGDVVFTSSLPHATFFNNGNLCRKSGTSHEQFGSVNANITVNDDDDFDWDDCLDDAVVNQLDLMECPPTEAKQDSIPDPEEQWHHEVTSRNVHPQLTSQSVVLQRSALIYSNRIDEDPEICSQSNMYGYIDDEDMVNLMFEHENLGSVDINSLDAQPLYWEQALRSDFEQLSKYASESRTPFPVVETSDLVVDEAFPPMHLDDVREDTAPGTRANERVVPPLSLNYAFDDNPQGMGAHDSSLRCSTPLTVERLSSEKESPICVYKHSELDFCHEDIVCAGSTDQMSIADDPAESSDHSCEATVGDGDEIVHLASEPPTTAEDGRTKKRRIHTPSSANALSSVTSANSRPGPNNLECDALGQPRRFVRSPYPTKVQDRSPITGFSPKTALRTCFRVGEALRDGSDAVRRGQDVVIELYARVVFSSRDVKWKQHFQFADLFHDLPPFLSGSYEVFSGSDLWEFDCHGFLGAEGKGKMCRCIGRMRRDGSGWKLVVLNIWEATWDDVKWVKGIVCA